MASHAGTNTVILGDDRHPYTITVILWDNSHPQHYSVILNLFQDLYLQQRPDTEINSA